MSQSAEAVSLICSGGETRRGWEVAVAEYLQVWQARVAEASVDRLLGVWPAAIAEARRLCPELLGAQLVRLEDGTWLDVLRWSCADGDERLMRHAERFDAVTRMHELLEDASLVGRGEIVAAGA